jgi:hypothetical protein
MQRYQHKRRDYLRNPQGRQHVEMAKAIGVVGSYETKRGCNSSLWHPHCHMIWLCYDKPDQAKLRQEWEEITGDSFMCDVTEFRNHQDPVEGFLEVFKYALKFSDMPLEDNWHAYKTLKTRRMLFSLGTFYGVKVPEELTDECLEDAPFVELFFRHTSAGYVFVKGDAERYAKRQARALQGGFKSDEEDRASVSESGPHEE